MEIYKLAGKATNIKPMWAKLVKASLELDPSVPSAKNTSLGYFQRVLEQNAQALFISRKLTQRLTSTDALWKVQRNSKVPQNSNPTPKATAKRRKPKA